MRVLVRGCLFTSVGVLILLLFTAIFATIPVVHGQQISRVFLGITVAAIVGYMLLVLGASFAMDKAGLNRDWFKTQDQLQKELEGARAQWEKARKLCHIIGDHEAVKMWDAKKAEEQDSKTANV